MRVPAVLFLCAATSWAAAQSAPWNYYGKTGPLGWGRLDPAYRACSQGKEQSPIDIRGAKLNKALQPIEFHYMSASVELENTGNTIVVHVKPGSYMIADGVRYELQEFDFHHPGEEAVNGRLTDMDVHLMHKSADGKLAMVAVRLSEDRGGCKCDPGGAVAAPARRSGEKGNRQRPGESRRAAARGPRLLDVYGLADNPAMHGRCALVCFRAAGQHQPVAVAGIRGAGVSDQFAAAAGQKWAEDRGE